jgi:hypothetical protein
MHTYRLANKIGVVDLGKRNLIPTARDGADYGITNLIKGSRHYKQCALPIKDVDTWPPSVMPHRCRASAGRLIWPKLRRIIGYARG